MVCSPEGKNQDPGSSNARACKPACMPRHREMQEERGERPGKRGSRDCDLCRRGRPLSDASIGCERGRGHTFGGAIMCLISVKNQGGEKKRYVNKKNRWSAILTKRQISGYPRSNEAFPRAWGRIKRFRSIWKVSQVERFLLAHVAQEQSTQKKSQAQPNYLLLHKKSPKNQKTIRKKRKTLQKQNK